MADLPVIMALDLASVSGWCCGKPGENPAHGSVRFASAGASHEAVFAAAAKWMGDKITFYAPGLVVWESPLPTSFSRGKSNTNTTTLLYGLPAIIGAVSFLRGVFDIRKAETRDVRNHFIGSNPKRVQAKKATIRQCHAMGWDVQSEDEADALATWHYMCALIEPKLALAPTPLFGRAISRGLR